MKVSFSILFLFVAACLYGQQQQQPLKVRTTIPSGTQPPVVLKKPAFLANATIVGGRDIPSGSTFKIDFTRTAFDESGNFSVADGAFTAPADGVYHFDVRVSWFKFTAPGVITLNLNKAARATTATSIQLSSTTQRLFDSNFSTLIKLKAGEKIMIYLKQDSGVPQKFQQVQFSGFKVD